MFELVEEQVEMYGALHKIGQYGFVFYKHDGKWLRSQKEPWEVRAAIRQAARREAAMVDGAPPAEPVAAVKKPKKPKVVAKPKRDRLAFAVDVLWKSGVSLTRLEWALQCGIPGGSMSSIVRELVKTRRVLRAAKKPVPGAVRPVQTFRVNKHKKRVEV
jgi:hypothetical protein